MCDLENLAFPSKVQKVLQKENFGGWEAGGRWEVISIESSPRALGPRTSNKLDGMTRLERVLYAFIAREYIERYPESDHS